MQLDVKDGLGQDQMIVAAGVESVSDRTVIMTGASIPVALANADRGGWWLQNQGADPIAVNELGAPAVSPSVAGNGSIVVEPGGCFPPPGYPLTTAQISLLGSVGDVVLFRMW